MKQPRLTNKQFQTMLTSILEQINEVHKDLGYNIEFSDDGSNCRIYPKTSFPFYTNYLKVYECFETLYGCSLWFEVYNGKPCLRIFNGL